MKKFLAAVTAAVALLFVPSVAMAAPQGASCALIVVTPEIPAQPAVIGYETIPAVTETLYEFVHRNPNHPNSPRWEAEGWNADSNPNSVGWVSTGATKEVVVTEESVRVVEISPAVPAVPAVTREECITEPPLWVPGPTGTAVPIPEPTATQTPAPTKEPAPVKVVETTKPVPVTEKPQAAVRTDLVAPAFTPAAASEHPEELAETGAESAGLLALIAVLAGCVGYTLIKLTRKR